MCLTFSFPNSYNIMPVRKTYTRIQFHPTLLQEFRVISVCISAVWEEQAHPKPGCLHCGGWALPYTPHPKSSRTPRGAIHTSGPWHALVLHFSGRLLDSELSPALAQSLEFYSSFYNPVVSVPPWAQWELLTPWRWSVGFAWCYTAVHTSYWLRNCATTFFHSCGLFSTHETAIADTYI